MTCIISEFIKLSRFAVSISAPDERGSCNGKLEIDFGIFSSQTRKIYSNAGRLKNCYLSTALSESLFQLMFSAFSGGLYHVSLANLGLGGLEAVILDN